MSRVAAPITLSAEERATLEAWSQSRTLPVRMAQRARMILLAADGAQSQVIARRMGISRPTVQLWRERFLARRQEGLAKDAPRPGRIPRITERTVRKIVAATLQTKPPNATQWSTRTMAKAQGVSEATVRRIWHQHQLKPHLTKSFKVSRDIHFVDKLYEIVGVIPEPARSVARAFCGREKSDPSA